uniref:Cytochrome c oxidase subunit 6B2 n=1 Tax=Salmo trutta TaxID=8032 RepID=A0A674F5H1_SALTR
SSEVIATWSQSISTAPFDARFPNTNQTQNCFQNYLGSVRQGQDVAPCEWYQRVYKSLFSLSLHLAKWDDQIEAGSFPGKI